jgi:hypothetical protein
LSIEKHVTIAAHSSEHRAANTQFPSRCPAHSRFGSCCDRCIERLIRVLRNVYAPSKHVRSFESSSSVQQAIATF